MNGERKELGMDYTINLSKGFRSYGQEITFKDFIFPGGEVHIRLDVDGLEIEENTICLINSRCQNSNDLMSILLAKDALYNIGIYNVNLFLPYFPYARQDRVVNKGECFSLKVICRLLFASGFKSVKTYDIHSLAHIRIKYTPIHSYLLLESVLNLNEVDLFLSDINKPNLLFVSPDEGARKKTEVASNAFQNWSGGVIHADKKRNTLTGKIEAIEVQGNVSGRDCIIIDDICDGGATFIGLAKALKEKGANDLYLFVSHGIFSKGLRELCKHYKLIGTTNSFRDEKDYEALAYYEGFNTDVKLRIYNI